MCQRCRPPFLATASTLRASTLRSVIQANVVVSPLTGTEQDFGANFEQENGANADVRACLIRRMRTMSLLGTLQKTRSEIDSGI
jgi:hypothetical protein